MSLGLFNCRLIQPAGDQLFFGSEGRGAGIDWEADRTEDKALLGSNLSAAPVAEIGRGRNPFPHLLHRGVV
jgi:hypothetical protein